VSLLQEQLQQTNINKNIQKEVETISKLQNEIHTLESQNDSLSNMISSKDQQIKILQKDKSNHRNQTINQSVLDQSQSKDNHFKMLKELIEIQRAIKRLTSENEALRKAVELSQM